MAVCNIQVIHLAEKLRDPCNDLLTGDDPHPVNDAILCLEIIDGFPLFLPLHDLL